jgi:hypothetical protein
MDRDDLELFARSLERATNGHTGAALDAALDDLGWPDALAADGRAAISLLFELQGAANATSSALDQVLAGALGHDGQAVVLPPIGHWRAPGAIDGRGLDVRGVASSFVGRCETALVVARVGDEHVALRFEVAALARTPIRGIDPALALVEVTGAIAGGTELGAVDWPAAVARGQLALGHELVGASRLMLDQAREHALGRVQFGQPIARFQAVRHRLADTLVAIELAAAVLEAAWLDGHPHTAAMAKATAGRSARVAARHCQQVLAGIGFTTEHPLHCSVRRVFALEQLLGSTRRLTVELGRAVVEHRRLPPVLPL